MRDLRSFKGIMVGGGKSNVSNIDKLTSWCSWQPSREIMGLLTSTLDISSEGKCLAIKENKREMM